MPNRSPIVALLSVALLLCAPAAVPATNATESPTPTATPAPSDSGCTGDCNADGQVTVDEVVRGVNVALGSAGVEQCGAMDRNGSGGVTVDELVTAVGNALSGCPAATPTPRPTFGELGTRRFSLAPETSRFDVRGLPMPLGSSGFEGYVDLTAGVPDPETGVAQVDITGASEYLSILVAAPLGPTFAICLKTDAESFPITAAGVVSCYDGSDLGYVIAQDHNIGVIGTDGFTEQECREAGGFVEPPDGAHPGVCNGPLVAEQPDADSGPGAVLLAPDPETLRGGLPVFLTQETELPCGDESAQGALVPLVLTTGRAVVTILDRNNVPENTLEIVASGENLSCQEWTVEDGPGTFVFMVPVLDLNAAPFGFFDLGNVFTFDD